MHWMVAITIVVLVGWKAVWLSAGVPDVTADADRARLRALQLLSDNPSANGYRLSLVDHPKELVKEAVTPILQMTGAESWDTQLPIWITPGEDGLPGWAGWDDNGNGEVDELMELGAAWSDDFCVVESDGMRVKPIGRIIDRGAYRKTRDGEQPDRLRYVWKR